MLNNTLRHAAMILLLLFAVQTLAGQPVELTITKQEKRDDDTILVYFELVWPDELPSSWNEAVAVEAVTGTSDAAEFQAISEGTEEEISELLQSKPRWHIFLEGSDGRYKSLYLDTLLRDPQLTFTDTFLQPGNFEYLIRANPIYTPVDKPRRERRTFRISGDSGDTGPGNDSTPDSYVSNYSNFLPGDDTTDIFIETSLFAAAPGDTVAIALNIRNNNVVALEGHQVDLVLPDSFNLIRKDIRNDEGFELDVKGSNGLGQKKHVHQAKQWSWLVPTLAPGESRTFFVDAVVHEDLARGDLNLAFDLAKTNTADNEPRSIFFLPPGADQQGTTIQAGITNSASFGTSISINRSRDPNHLSIFPDVLYPGQSNVVLNMEAHFQNVGDAPVKELKVFYFRPHPLLDRESYKVTDQVFLRGSASIDDQNLPTAPTWTRFQPMARILGARSTSGWLPGLQMFRNPADSIYSMGHIEFSFTTKPEHQFSIGESIWGKILIEMDGDTLSDATQVPVIEPPTFRLPPRFGGKAGVNYYPAVFAGSGLTPFHAGVFGLFPLDPARPTADITRLRKRFNYAELPRFYLQVEALYNQLTESVSTLGVTRDYTSIDLPIQLRWAPQSIGPINLKRLLGISAGITPSYVLSSEASSGSELNEDSGFELYGHLDIGSGNFITNRFISLGLRYNHLLTKGVLKDRWGGYGQLYVQISL